MLQEEKNKLEEKLIELRGRLDLEFSLFMRELAKLAESNSTNDAKLREELIGLHLRFEETSRSIKENVLNLYNSSSSSSDKKELTDLMDKISKL